MAMSEKLVNPLLIGQEPLAPCDYLMHYKNRMPASSSANLDQSPKMNMKPLGLDQGKALAALNNLKANVTATFNQTL